MNYIVRTTFHKITLGQIRAIIRNYSVTMVTLKEITYYFTCDLLFIQSCKFGQDRMRSFRDMTYYISFTDRLVGNKIFKFVC